MCAGEARGRAYYDLLVRDIEKRREKEKKQRKKERDNLKTK